MSLESYRPSRVSGLFAGPQDLRTYVRGAQELGRSVRRVYDNQLKRKRVKSEPLPKKNMPKRSRSYGSAVNSLAGRASMKMTTKKLKAKRVKKIKVSPRLRKQVKQILTGSMLTGKYVCSRIGTIGCGNPLTNPGTVTLYGVAVSPAFYPLQSVKSTHNYSSFFVPRRINPGTIDVRDANYNNFDAFTFFHPAKIMDACSVLWNKKNIDTAGWTTQVGNIQTRISNVGAEGDTNRPSNVKFHIVNTFVEFELKNNSPRVCRIRIINCTPKHKILNAYPLDTLVSGISEDFQENGVLGAVNSDANVTNPLFNPRDSAYFSGQYKYSTMEIVINPGETCKHSLQGPKNTIFDTTKYLVNTLDGEQYNMKGTVSCVFQVMPDVQVQDGTFGSGYYIQPTSLANDLRQPISVTYTETYLLKCPETAGFIKNNAAAGAIQTLNQKRTVTAYGLFSSFNADAHPYTGADEENVGLGISSSAALVAGAANPKF